MLFDVNKTYQDLDSFLGIDLDGGEGVKMTAYSMSQCALVPIPAYMNPEKGVGVVRFSGDTGCFIFESGAFFSKAKFIWHNPLAIHPDYTCTDERKIGAILDIALKNHNGLFQFENANVGASDKEGQRQLNERIEKNKNNKFLVYAPKHAEFSSGPAIITPGKSLRHQTSEQQQKFYYFALFDSEGLFVFNDKKEKVRGGFLFSNYKTRRAPGGTMEPIMPMIRTQLNIMTSMPGEAEIRVSLPKVNMSTENIELANTMNGKFSRMGGFYSIIRNPAYKDIFQYSFPEEMKYLLATPYSEDEKSNVVPQIMNMILQRAISMNGGESSISEGNIRNIYKICKIDPEKIAEIRIQKGWQNYFVEELDSIARQISATTTPKDSLGVLANFLQKSSEAFYVTMTEFRDQNNESFPLRGQDGNLLTAMRNRQKDIVGKIAITGKFTNETAVVSGIITEFIKQLECAFHIKASDIYQQYYDRDYGNPEFEEKSRLKKVNRLNQIKSNPITRPVYYIFQFVVKLIPFFKGAKELLKAEDKKGDTNVDVRVEMNVQN